MRSNATLMVVKKTVSGVPGAAGKAATEVVEEEQNPELGTVLSPEMEAGSVWDPAKRRGAATTRTVKKKRKRTIASFKFCLLNTVHKYLFFQQSYMTYWKIFLIFII